MSDRQANSPRVAVIDYHTGNSQSVGYALQSLGVEHCVVQKPKDAQGASHFILPGVGSAGTTMRYLEQDGWLSFLNEHVREDGLPFLGICIGMQILFEESEEQSAECFGWLPGRVRSFDRTQTRVPHMGWNKVSMTTDHPFVSGFSSDEYFYFVNSYYVVPDDPSIQVGTTEYGKTFASVVARDNIMATQFHIEKSGPVGLQLLKRFTQIPSGVTV